MRQIYVIAHDIRSALNVGSLMRTAEGLGVSELYLTGYTPHPSYPGDKRLPHIANKLNAQIDKTALGANVTLKWSYSPDIEPVIEKLRSKRVKIAALEQTKDSTALNEYKDTGDIALVLGNEATGLAKDILKISDLNLEIPMLGHKESFNVVQAAAMALYHLRFF